LRQKIKIPNLSQRTREGWGTRELQKFNVEFITVREVQKINLEFIRRK